MHLLAQIKCVLVTRKIETIFGWFSRNFFIRVQFLGTKFYYFSIPWRHLYSFMIEFIAAVRFCQGATKLTSYLPFFLALVYFIISPVLILTTARPLKMLFLYLTLVDERHKYMDPDVLVTCAVEIFLHIHELEPAHVNEILQLMPRLFNSISKTFSGEFSYLFVYEILF